MTTVGVLHPGEMGSVLASVLPGRVLWVGAGRSDDSHRRATEAGIDDVGSLAAMAAEADIILSVCPPEAADATATDVASAGFEGLYVDANAVSPETARRISSRFDRFVDGGIVGPPPTAPGLTRLYLSGEETSAVADLFAGTVVEARVVEGGPGAASAVKMCFASWTKGTSALLLAIRALADAEGVAGALLGEWETSLPELVARSEKAAAATGPKAWRFEGEMHQIADSFTSAGLPGDFHRGAAEIYRRMAPLKGRDGTTLADALRLLDARTHARD
ncbi:MAG: DUF1932 domain-containing protein [Acidimicrobiia bacterium]|nr:DUF1932 domain-containing protein [Acidimicrobiia bacterium]